MSGVRRLDDAPWLKSGPAARVLTLLNGDGEEARVVGGAVRNALLDLPIGDVDIATTALPQEVTRRAKAAGITNFVDQQISIPAEEALLQARILNVRPPFANFYRAALGAIDSATNKTKGHKFAELPPQEQHDFINLMRQNKIEGWQGPPGPFVFTVLRSDAVDVVYATMDGYAMLGIPYMPHVPPIKKW